jgi:hypothetical protein
MWARAAEKSLAGATAAAVLWGLRARAVTDVHYGQVRLLPGREGTMAVKDDAKAAWRTDPLVVRVTTGGNATQVGYLWGALAAAPASGMGAWIATRKASSSGMAPLTLVAGNRLALFRHDCGSLSTYAVRAAVLGLMFAALPTPLSWTAAVGYGVLVGVPFTAVDIALCHAERVPL